MIKVHTLILGELRTNCYLVENKHTKEAIIIDPANDEYKIKECIKKHELIPKAILLTHGHFDHITALKAVKSEYNIACYCGRYEKDLLEDPIKNLSTSYGGYTLTINPDVLFSDYQEIKIAGIKIKVIETPGHTKGSVSYFVDGDKIVFTGDTLFRGTVGRTDLPTSSYEDLLISLNNKLMKLDMDTIVYPGHGYRTTIGKEKKENPYVYRNEGI